MKRFILHFTIFIAIIFLFLELIIHFSSTTRNHTANSELIIADFNTIPPAIGKPIYNNIGGQYGVWNRFANDPTQQCSLSFVNDDVFKQGTCIQLDYDVDSLNPAYNGFWMKLNDADFTLYDTLNFYCKGQGNNFTSRLKVELKDAYNTATYVIDGITEDWQFFQIPFEKYQTIRDWTAMKEFVIVFDDILSDPESGSIRFDHITVSSKK